MRVEGGEEEGEGEDASWSDNLRCSWKLSDDMRHECIQAASVSARVAVGSCRRAQVRVGSEATHKESGNPKFEGGCVDRRMGGGRIGGGGKNVRTNGGREEGESRAHLAWAISSSAVSLESSGNSRPESRKLASARLSPCVRLGGAFGSSDAMMRSMGSGSIGSPLVHKCTPRSKINACLLT